jgi:hypothetical protein
VPTTRLQAHAWVIHQESLSVHNAQIPQRLHYHCRLGGGDHWRAIGEPSLVDWALLHLNSRAGPGEQAGGGRLGAAALSKMQAR